MAIGSKDLVTEQLDGFDNARLVEELKKAKEELFNLRFQSATVKRDIARIYTVLRERELGIRQEVVVPVEEAKKAKKSSKKATEADATEEAK